MAKVSVGRKSGQRVKAKSVVAKLKRCYTSLNSLRKECEANGVDVDPSGSARTAVDIERIINDLVALETRILDRIIKSRFLITRKKQTNKIIDVRKIKKLTASLMP